MQEIRLESANICDIIKMLWKYQGGSMPFWTLPQK